MRKWKQSRNLVVAVLAILLVPAVAYAATPQTSSPHYQVNEAFFGSGGELHACASDGNGDGTTYCSKQSAGELAVGKTESAHYLAQGGFNTDRVPSLTFVVDPVSTDLGVLTPGTPATTTGTFSVKSYLSSGYVVITTADPPTNGSYTMKTFTTPTALDTSKEQFGINLAANSTPSVGAAPNQVPDSSFSFGQAAAGYDTPDQFKYAKGDVIAQSLKGSGQTDYTISYLFNVTNVTPAGQYHIDDVLVATSTF